MSRKKESSRREYSENTMDIVRGSLDEISRTPSSKKRPGSRVSLGSASSITRRTPDVKQSLEYLPPEQPTFKEYDIEVEEYDSDEDSNTDLADYKDESVPQTRSLVKGHGSTKQLVLPNKTENNLKEEDIPTAEERDIIKQIKEEIRNQVKEEMKDELAQYRLPDTSTKDQKDEEEDMEEMDPKIKEAILKMRKYDRILKKVTKREKNVKRQRIALQKQLRDELDELKAEVSADGKRETKDISVNTEKFLALEPPPKHNEGVMEDSPPVSPVFPTQVLDHDRESVASGTGTATGASGSTSKSPRSEHSEASSKKSKKKQQKEDSKDNKDNKDFIKRNIELAGDAANMIAMTDDEKERLELLLGDLESLPELPEGETEAASENPFQIVIQPGDGFVPGDDDMKALKAIDERLKSLLPFEDFQSISSTPRPHTPQQSFFTRTGVKHSIDFDNLGEKALKETKEHRELSQRLRDIEIELSQLTSAVDREISSPALSEDQLQDLLDQCSRTMSRATAETESLNNSPRSNMSSKDALMENPPKLDTDVLQKLLEEARREQGSREGASGDDNHWTNMEPISEEVVQELLINSRATSRSTGRSSSTARSASTDSDWSTAEREETFSDNENTLYGNTHTEDSQSHDFEKTIMEDDESDVDREDSLSYNKLKSEKSNKHSNHVLKNSFSESDASSKDTASKMSSSVNYLDGMQPRPPSTRRSGQSSISRTYSPLSYSNEN